MTERKDKNKEGCEIKTFTVPFDLREIKENITFKTNVFSNHSKKRIIIKIANDP